MQLVYAAGLAVLAVSLCAGCTSTRSSGSQTLTEGNIRSIEKGKTTESDLRRTFGPPLSRTTDPQGFTNLTWTHATVKSPGPMTYLVPVPLPSDRHLGQSGKTLMVKLGPDGTVADYTTSEMNSGGLR